MEGGWRVKELDDCFIDVLEMGFNYRVVRSEKPHTGFYDMGFCYFGKTLPDFLRAVLGAAGWDGRDETKPEGWDKDILTQEISADGRARIERRDHS